jgi:lantibiotic modifying enzyme
LNTLKSNSFDDEEIEKALSDLNKVWQKVSLTRSIFVSNYGNIDLLISSLKNVDESVTLNACKCLLTLLYREEGAQDIFLRHRGV